MDRNVILDVKTFLQPSTQNAVIIRQYPVSPFKSEKGKSSA